MNERINSLISSLVLAMAAVVIVRWWERYRETLRATVLAHAFGGSPYSCKPGCLCNCNQPGCDCHYGT